MPLTEAQACGIPSMAVKYSAMEDHLDSPTAIPIEVERFFYEAIIETEQRRALPSNKDFINKLDIFLKKSLDQHEAMRQATRDYIVEPVETYGQDIKMPRRSWDRTAAIWKCVLNECEIYDPETTWLYPKPRIHKPLLVMPKQNMNNTEFVRWVISTIWNRPDFVNTYFAGEWVTALNTGFKNEANQRVPMNRQKMVDQFIQKVQHYNAIEQKRLASLQKIDPDRISVAVI